MFNHVSHPFLSRRIIPVAINPLLLSQVRKRNRHPLKANPRVSEANSCYSFLLGSLEAVLTIEEGSASAVVWQHGLILVKADCFQKVKTSIQEFLTCNNRYRVFPFWDKHLVLRYVTSSVITGIMKMG